MASVSKPTQKKLLIGGGGLVVLYLLYRWYQGRSTSTAAQTAAGTAATGAGTTDGTAPVGSGQEQSDVSGLAGQEQSDVNALASGITAASAQEQSDVAALTAGEAQNQSLLQQIQSQVAAIVAPVAPAVAAAIEPTPSVAHIATGQVKAKRAANTGKAGAAKTGKKIQTTGSEIAANAAKRSGNVNHNYQPHKNASAVAPSHHGVPPRKVAIPSPNIEVAHPKVGGAHPHVVVPKPVHKVSQRRAGPHPGTQASPFILIPAFHPPGFGATVMPKQAARPRKPPPKPAPHKAVRR